MLRAFGVYLERAETFRKPLKTSCSTRCLSERIRWCINFYFVLANTAVCEGHESAFWAAVQVISCFSTSAVGICRAAIPNSAHLCSSVDLVNRFDSCYERNCGISYLNCSLHLSYSRLLQLGICRGSTEAWLVALIL